MKLALTLALRNLFRNSRRTWINLAMIIGGFVAIVIFKGFCLFVLQQLEIAAVNGQYGHIQIGKKAFFDHDQTVQPRQLMIENGQDLIAKVEKNENVSSASGRIGFFGLLNSEQKTVSLRGVGLQYEKEIQFQEKLKIVEGSKLKPGAGHQVIIGEGLNKSLKAKPGDSLVMVASTYDGTVNAVDVTVAGVFQTTVSEVDDFMIFTGLDTAQRLLDADGFESLVVYVNEADKLKNTAEQIKSQIADTGLLTKQWREIAILFRKVESFWDKQNAIIGGILTLIILLGISNTVGMALYERTGEIGTLRALGLKQGDVFQNFILESILLGLIGAFIAIPLSLISIQVLKSLHMMIELPGASAPIPVQFIVVPSSFLSAFALALLTPVLASLPAVRKLTRKNIVEALRHNI